jgi:phosphodiesterase/alkaline phosphatase D-like protein
MSIQYTLPSAALSRRAFVRSLGIGGLALAAAPAVGQAATLATAPEVWLQASSAAGAPGPVGVHLQFGQDASSEMVVSWTTDTAVRRPRVRLGNDDDFGDTIAAETRTYIDARSGVEVFTHHARLDDLRPAHTYVYQAFNDGADPVGGSFTTAPRGRSRMRFTSFGDEATPVAPNGTPPFAACGTHSKPVRSASSR